jgi:hypothetical protein
MEPAVDGALIGALTAITGTGIGATDTPYLERRREKRDLARVEVERVHDKRERVASPEVV